MTIDNQLALNLLKTAKDAAFLAGKNALQKISSAKAEIKNNSELVTQVDAECQKIIIDTVTKTFPDHGFLGEEGEKGNLYKKSPAPDQDFWWIIDPIDGTNNYAHNLPNFSVSIGVFHEGAPVAAVVYDPTTNTMFAAAKDQNATRNEKPIKTGTEKISKYASISIDSHFDGFVPQYAKEIILTTRSRSFGSSALHLAYLAHGGLIAAVMPKTKLWDIAAGILIAAEAGATITDFNGNPILPIDLENYKGQPIPTLAANPAVHNQILQMIKTKNIR
jgi:myo-inositol-1(or 4)-monophosphatase